MNAKIMAMIMVGVMMFSGLAITMGNEENTLDAVVGDGGAYSYTLTYHADQMGNTAAQELQLTVADMTPISHDNTGTYEALDDGSWAFNTTTGIGPFNSFYAAFDVNDGNKFVSILNPYNLSETLGGVSLSSLGGIYNIMWILPTVYWSVDNSGNLTLTNNPNSGGTAYAHTIDGHTYKYLALGVYEGSTKSINSTTTLTSTSGSTPTTGQTISTFRTYAENNTMDSTLGQNAYPMLWSYYQYSLYKYCSYIVMEGFNSQAIVGNGNVYGHVFSTTGSTDSLGPYVGNNDVYTGASGQSNQMLKQNSKLFLENTWGSINEFINGILVYQGQGYYINTSHSPGSATSGTYVEYIQTTLPSSGWISGISLTEKLWGLPAATESTYNDVGLSDYTYTSTSGTSQASVGGFSFEFGTERAYYYGISYAGLSGITSSYSDGNVGSRLAFVMDQLSDSFSVSFDVNDNSYGTLSNSTTINVSPNATISISSSSLTIEDTTVTATPSTDTAQYDYSFVGWYNGATPLQNGDTVTGDMTITATFSRTTNQYTVTASVSPEGYGTVTSALTKDYGSSISASSNVLTVGDGSITATPTTADAQYTYTFVNWTGIPLSGELTADTAITANFDRSVNTYTITWSISGSTTSETLPYGAMPEHADPTPPEGYLFAGWNPEIAAVTGDQTYTAVFEEIVYITVTFDPNGGQLEGPSTKTVGIGTPYGELPTPKKDNNKFLGWFTDPEEGTQVTADTIVTADADQTLYAHWELTGFAAMLKPLLFLFPLILLAFLAIALVRTFA